jgi:hypothetical protein
MRPRNPKQITEDEREREIRRLESVRDKLLDAAPKHFYAKRLMLPVMLAATVLVIIDGARVHPASLTLWAGLFLAVFLFLIGHGTWKVWHSTPAPGDKWGLFRSTWLRGRQSARYPKKD